MGGCPCPPSEFHSQLCRNFVKALSGKDPDCLTDLANFELSKKFYLVSSKQAVFEHLL